MSFFSNLLNVTEQQGPKVKTLGVPNGEPNTVSTADFNFEDSYQRRPSALTDNELSFFRVLAPLVDPQWRIFAKVRLEDIIEVKRGAFSKKEYYGLRSRIKSRHVDFVLCDRDTLEYLMIVELDDPSHERADRKRRDKFVDEAVTGAGLTIVHIPARLHYDQSYIMPYLFED